mmetsp:Transcript_7972/g.7054  ORF Transcript_7972/g.7054 Transcript_7972/m.7054 type:complete len:86 (-) Transcript_7972:49-306(-)
MYMFQLAVNAVFIILSLCNKKKKNKEESEEEMKEERKENYISEKRSNEAETASTGRLTQRAILKPREKKSFELSNNDNDEINRPH